MACVACEPPGEAPCADPVHGLIRFAYQWSDKRLGPARNLLLGMDLALTLLGEAPDWGLALEGELHTLLAATLGQEPGIYEIAKRVWLARLVADCPIPEGPPPFLVDPS